MALTGCASVRGRRRFLQQPCPRILELCAPVAAPRLVRAPGRMQAMNGPDPEGPEQRGELVRADRSPAEVVRPLLQIRRQCLTQALRSPLLCATPNVMQRRE